MKEEPVQLSNDKARLVWFWLGVWNYHQQHPDMLALVKMKSEEAKEKIGTICSSDVINFLLWKSI